MNERTAALQSLQPPINARIIEYRERIALIKPGMDITTYALLTSRIDELNAVLGMIDRAIRRPQELEPAEAAKLWRQETSTDGRGTDSKTERSEDAPGMRPATDGD